MPLRGDTVFNLGARVTVTIPQATVVAVWTSPPKRVVRPYQTGIQIVNILPIGSEPSQLPLGSQRNVTIYGLDGNGLLYDISGIAWMSPPQVVAWGTVTGPPMPGNLTQQQRYAWQNANVLQLSYTQQQGAPGKLVGMSFSEIAPVGSQDTVSNIQVTSVVQLNDGSNGWSFNDSITTVPVGTPPAPFVNEYDLVLPIPADPPYTIRAWSVPETSLS